jgi:hypothetical protein
MVFEPLYIPFRRVFSGAQQKGVAVQWEIVLAILWLCMAQTPAGLFLCGSNSEAPCLAVRYLLLPLTKLGRCGSRQHLCGAALSYRRAGSLVQQLASGTPTYGHLAHSNTCYTSPHTHTHTHQLAVIKPSGNVILKPHFVGRPGAGVKRCKIDLFSTIPDTALNTAKHGSYGGLDHLTILFQLYKLYCVKLDHDW